VDILRDFLGELGDFRSGGELDAATVGFDFAFEYAQQSRLARAVAAQETDAFARLDLAGDFIEQHRATKAYGEVAERNEWHGLFCEGQLLATATGAL
jgi:hypothetical protein